MIDQAVILCGGRGTRLGALTAELPKPLVPVDEAPFLDLLLFELGRHGIRRILLLGGFAGARITEYAAATPLKARLGLAVEVGVEPEPAGTGGALWHARHRLDDSFVVLNGDSWFDVNFLDLAARLAQDPAALGVIALRQLPDAARYGAASLSGDRIVAFAERPAGSGPGLVSGGVYAVRRAVVDRLGPQASLEAELFPRLPRRGICAEASSIGILSISACPRIWRGPGARSRSGGGALRRFSTATASSTMMTGMSAPSRSFAGSRAPGKRSRRSTIPGCSSFS